MSVTELEIRNTLDLMDPVSGIIIKNNKEEIFISTFPESELANEMEIIVLLEDTGVMDWIDDINTDEVSKAIVTHFANCGYETEYVGRARQDIISGRIRIKRLF